MKPVMNLEQFAKEYGGTTTADVQMHIHAGLRSMPTTKTYQRWFKNRLRELQDKRDQTVSLYRMAIESGIVEAPKERSYEEIAKGEGKQAEAAQRVLVKRKARREATQG